MADLTAIKSRTAVAPCSTANLGPGYDVFGLALDALEDRVKISAAPNQSKGSIQIKMLGDSPGISTAAESNSAGLVIRRMAREHGINDGLLVEVRKGVPAGYGLGSSAASAAAAALAFKELYRLKIDINSLVEYAAEGEMASAGTKHYDNVSASIIGGFVVSSPSSGDRRFIGIKPPSDLVLVAAVPVSMQVPEKKTEVARQVLPREVSLKDVVHNVSSASTVVAGFALKDVEMIARGIDDVIVEPARKHLIPGYDAVRQKALAAGALAVTISGAGPSMISFMKSGKKAKLVAEAMSEGFAGAGLQSKTFVCRPSRGARLV
jgi:homoserine kinase